MYIFYIAVVQVRGHTADDDFECILFINQVKAHPYLRYALLNGRACHSQYMQTWIWSMQLQKLRFQRVILGILNRVLTSEASQTLLPILEQNAMQIGIVQTMLFAGVPEKRLQNSPLDKWDAMTWYDRHGTIKLSSFSSVPVALLRSLNHAERCCKNLAPSLSGIHRPESGPSESFAIKSRPHV